MRSSTEKFVLRLHELYGIELRTKERQLDELAKDYAQYKKQNDLEAYFAKNLSEESRERVLEDVKQLMQITDWSYFDPTTVLKMESKNPQAFLEKVLTENENQQRKKAADLAREQEEILKAQEDDPS